MKIVQLANFHAANSGGLRTAVDTLGRAYRDAGHERVLVVPGTRTETRETDVGRLVTVPGWPVAGGYRMICRTRPVLDVLDRLGPDSVEVSDKATLLPVGGWARGAGVPAVLFSHERLDATLGARLPGWIPVRAAADRWNRRLVDSFDVVVVTSDFAWREFARVAAPRLYRIPLGVDLQVFHPVLRPALDGGRRPRLVYAGRLSPEKRPEVAIGALRRLLAAGQPAVLDILGDGPLAPRLRRLAAGLPVTFHGHVGSRADLARLIAAADVALAPCPVESFGLSVLEALACGTPVVTAAAGATPELIAPDAGVAVPAEPRAFAAGVRAVLAGPAAVRTAAARAQAERYPWATTAQRMLALHTQLAARSRGTPDAVTPPLG